MMDLNTDRDASFCGEVDTDGHGHICDVDCNGTNLTLDLSIIDVYELWDALE